MEIVLCFLVAWYMTRDVATDTVAMVKRVESPRRAEREARAQRFHERAMARDARRQGPTLGEAFAQRMAQRVAVSGPRQKQRGPARAYLAELWRDGWEAAGERHRTVDQRRQDGELPRQKATRWVRERVARVRDRRVPSGRHAHGQPRQPQQAGPVRSPSARADRCDECGKPVGAHCPDCEACDLTDACRDGTCVVDDPNPHPEPPVGGPDGPWWDPGSTTEPEADENASDSTTPAPEPMAPVIPIRGDNLMTTNTSTGSGETVDPEQALAFAQSMAGVAESAASECETSISTLTEHGVTGGPIEQLAAMQEAFETAAGTAGTAAGFFQQHIDAADAAKAAQQTSGMGGGRYAGIGS